jgi:nicotinamidase-related amidase
MRRDEVVSADSRLYLHRRMRRLLEPPAPRVSRSGCPARLYSIATLGGVSMIMLACVLGVGTSFQADAGEFAITLRQRLPGVAEGDEHRIHEEPARWAGRETAVIVCDMWDRHWCRGATERVGAMAPRLNEFIKAARARGALIIHCPSDTLGFYRETAQRQLAQAAPKVEPRVPLQNWCGRDPDREPPLPIDDADGGCDDDPPCGQGHPWTRQIATIEIHEEDAISDSAEVFNLMTQRGIRNAMITGVHLNMCVLGRPFGIRQLVRQGLNVALVRDLTDTMYNSRQRPRVNHFTGTDLMVEHVEKYWCPTLTSAELLGGLPFRFPADTRPRVVLMIGEDEYQTWQTLPRWASSDLLPRGYAVTIIVERPEDPGDFPGLISEIRTADLLMVSVRRRALPADQLDAVRRHLALGRPLIGLRTTSHAFAPRGAALDPVRTGVRSEWPDFDPAVLGGNYQGHHGHGPKTRLSIVPQAAGHPILEGLDLSSWTGHGSLYRTQPLAAPAVPLIMGSVTGQAAEPVAWTHTFGSQAAPVFYTSLGHPEDFDEPAFRGLLDNAVRWCLARRDSRRDSR